jgi:hypothetical protein
MDGEQSLAERVAGAKPPRSFILDASALEFAEEHKIVREDVKRNRIVFEFPDGMNTVDLFEECRALDRLDDFDVMYDLAMQKLAGKPVLIWMRQDDGSRTLFCEFRVTDRYQNLRGVSEIDQYPILVRWLADFIGADMLKKYPTPTRAPSRRQESKSPAATERTKPQAES